MTKIKINKMTDAQLDQLERELLDDGMSSYEVERIMCEAVGEPDVEFTFHVDVCWDCLPKDCYCGNK